MARKLFYVAILLAIVSQGLASQTQTNTTDCNAESCVFPERDNPQFCSESLAFLDCVKDNVVDNGKCLPIQRAAGESVIFLGKYAMLLNDCQDVPGTYCDLRECPPPIDEGEDVCQKVRAYQKCLVDEIIENNQCALFEKGAAVSKLVMTALNFTNCNEGEGHSWVEDNENQPPQAPAVLLNLIHNDTETYRDLRSEAKFKHFGAELCEDDKQLVNDQEPRPFGPEREEDAKLKPRPEGLEQDESDEWEQDDESVEAEQDENIEEELDESVEVEEDESVEVEGDESDEIEKDEEELHESVDMKQGENVELVQGDSVEGELRKNFDVVQDEILSESGDVTGYCVENVPHFKADSDCTEESDRSVKSKQGLKQYKPVSYVTGESMEKEIKHFKSCSFSNRGDKQEEIRKLQEDIDGDVDIKQEDRKQLHSDSFTSDEATESHAQQIAQHSMSFIPIESKSEKSCPAKSEPITPTSPSDTPTSPSDTPTSIALSRPLKFGLVARDGRPKKVGTVSRTA